MIQVEIPKHPDYPFLDRKVTALEVTVPLDLSANPEMAARHTRGNEVILYTLLEYFKEGESEPVSIVPGKVYPLRADKATWVDQNGEIVPEFIEGADPENEGQTIQIKNPKAFMNQYAFFMMIIDNKIPVVFDTLIRKHITDAATLFFRYDD